MPLDCRRISVRLGGRQVLHDVELAIGEGEVVGLIGPNGAGKSTLLRAIAGLQPCDGEILYDGGPLHRLGRRRRAALVAYLAQAESLHWPLTVARTAALGRMPHLGPWQAMGPEDHRAVVRALEACDLAGLADRAVNSLSGGERARALLARVLATEPALLLADEPVAGLDPYHQIQVMELLRRRAGEGMSTVVVLHDLLLAARFCDRLALIHEGRAVAAGSPPEVLTPEILRGVYHVDCRRWEGDGLSVWVPWNRADSGEAA